MSTAVDDNKKGSFLALERSQIAASLSFAVCFRDACGRPRGGVHSGVEAQAVDEEDDEAGERDKEEEEDEEQADEEEELRLE